MLAAVMRCVIRRHLTINIFLLIELNSYCWFKVEKARGDHVAICVYTRALYVAR